MDWEVINIKLEANTLDEWRKHVGEFNCIVREWKVPITVGASGTPEVLPEGDDRVPGAGALVAHGYQGFSEKGCKSGTSSVTHSLVLRSTCPIPAEDKWICHDMRSALLDEGYLVSCQEGDPITHLFHVGRVEEKGRGWLSFAARMTDEEALIALMRDFNGVQCLKIEGGVYLGMDVHP